MASEGFDAAEAHGILGDREPAQEVERGAFAALELEREHRAREIRLRVTDADLLRIGEQRRVVEASDARMPGQRLHDALGILALTRHAELDRRQSAVQKPALVRLQDVAENRAHAAQA